MLRVQKKIEKNSIAYIFEIHILKNVFLKFHKDPSIRTY